MLVLTCRDFGDLVACCGSCHEDEWEAGYALQSPPYPGRLDVSADLCCAVAGLVTAWGERPERRRVWADALVRHRRCWR